MKNNDDTYRSVRDAFWTDVMVLDLLPEEKFFYLWLLTNPHVDPCGCYQVSMKTVEYETGLSRDTILNLTSRFVALGRILYNEQNHEFILLKWKKNNSGFFNVKNTNSIKGIRQGASKILTPEFKIIVLEWLGEVAPTEGATLAPYQAPIEGATPQPLTINLEPKPKGEEDEETHATSFSHEVENKPSRLTVTDIRFIHSEHFGLQFPPGASNLAVEICERFSAEAIREAFEAAAVHNKPSMAYVLGVLNGNGGPKSVLREDQKPRGRPVTFGESTSIANQEASQRVLRRLLDGQKNAGDTKTCGIDFQISGSNGNGNVGGEADCIPGGVG